MLTYGLRQYRKADILVNKKIGQPITPDLRPEIARRIKDLRSRLGLTQVQLAEICGVRQATVAGWEKEDGTDRPGPVALVKIARIAPEGERDWWDDRAELKELRDAYAPTSTTVRVPLLEGKIAAGLGRDDIEGERETGLGLPKQWFAPGSKIVALQVEGDSMAPLILTGYYVLIDISERDIKRLAGFMVAARSPHGCTVKWLRKEEATGFYQLIPQHVSEDYDVRTITPENQEDFRIIGRVVRWIGAPNPPKKRMKR